jgi:hypothetical protein
VFIDPGTQIAQSRHAFAQKLAAQSAVLVQKQDTKTLKIVFEAVRRSDPGIQSIAVRKADGSFQVKVGNHESAWIEPPRDRSTLYEVAVPLSQGREHWGRF